MGSDATVRYQRAKIRVMQQEMEQVSADYKETGRQLSEERQQHKKDCEQLGVLQRRLKSQDTEVKKQRKRADFTARKLETAELELAAVKKELEVALRSRKADRGDISTKDVRLNRALEELEKFRSLLNERQSQERDKQADVKGELDRLARENKKLEKHKTELIAAFRKQAKLIDVLKRQKLHIEAARMLALTEEEFTVALEG
jgi:chromosome segregation ATPase